jgi:type II secretory pathway predicted ATPase ExeA
MYETFYGMRERPFALTPDPSFLFMSSKHSLALSMLEYSLMGQAGFTVVTGEIGSGKTTLIRRFLTRAGNGINLGVVSNTHAGFGDLLQWILLAFELESEGPDKATRYQAFADYLVSQYSAGKQTILIIDEAQNLTIDALEELRLLSNINSGRNQLIQMILVGQPELLEKLRSAELTQFAQRIAVHYHLTPLSNVETRDYIRHRLHVAGVHYNLFDEPAIAAVFHFSNGVPRLINSLCDMALVYGYAQGRREIDIDVIWAVVQDREKGALLPLQNRSNGITREELIKSASDLSVQQSCSSPNDGSDADHPEIASLGTNGTVGPTENRGEARNVLHGRETSIVMNRDEISAYVHREVQRLAVPIAPAYLNEMGEVTEIGAKRVRRSKSKWLWWLP